MLAHMIDHLKKYSATKIEQMATLLVRSNQLVEKYKAMKVGKRTKAKRESDLEKTIFERKQQIFKNKQII